MNESRLIGGIILFIIIVMILSYFLITITNPNYPIDNTDIVQIYITYFNNSSFALFENIQYLYNEITNSSPSDVIKASKYFANIDTSKQVLTLKNQSAIFKSIDIYLAAVESLISSYIGNNIKTINLVNVIGSYNDFMIPVVGYDIENETNLDVRKIYNIKGMTLITPFGKIRRVVIKNDPNESVMNTAFNNEQGCFIFI